MTEALDEITPENVSTRILIRGEEHTLPLALTRSITHIAYHAGQLVLIARQVHAGEWNWLTIAPGGSQQHNQQTWGTSASRSVLGRQDDAD